MANPEINTGSILNRQFTRREALRFTAGSLGAIATAVIADKLKPLIALAQVDGEVPLDQLPENEHPLIYSDLGRPELSSLVFALTTATAVDSILEHVLGRNRRAQREDYKNGHCVDTARMFLEELLPRLLGDEGMLNRLQISEQMMMGKAGNSLGKTYRLVLHQDGTTAANHGYKAIVSYIHETPVKGNKYGTVYVVEDLNILKGKGRPITDRKEKEDILNRLNNNLNGTDSDPTNCGNKSTVTEAVPAAVPAANPVDVTQSEASVSLVLGGLPFPVILAGLALAGARLLLRGGRQSEASA